MLVGSPDFVATIWANLRLIYEVAPDDYDVLMTCVMGPDGRTMTRVRRIVQADPPYSARDGAYSDSTGTIWLELGSGTLWASLLLHEAVHITRTGWNWPPGSRDCGPEDNTLEWQARFLERAAAAAPSESQRRSLLWYAGWYRAQKGVWQCPA